MRRKGADLRRCTEGKSRDIERPEPLRAGSMDPRHAAPQLTAGEALINRLPGGAVVILPPPSDRQVRCRSRHESCFPIAAPRPISPAPCAIRARGERHAPSRGGICRLQMSWKKGMSVRKGRSDRRQIYLRIVRLGSDRVLVHSWDPRGLRCVCMCVCVCVPTAVSERPLLIRVNREAAPHLHHKRRSTRVSQGHLGSG